MLNKIIKTIILIFVCFYCMHLQKYDIMSAKKVIWFWFFFRIRISIKIKKNLNLNSILLTFFCRCRSPPESWNSYEMNKSKLFVLFWLKKKLKLKLKNLPPFVGAEALQNPDSEASGILEFYKINKGKFLVFFFILI